MTGNDFRLYAGVDFSNEFLVHYGVGHDKGGHSGRYPWGSGKRPKQDEQSSTDAESKETVSEEEHVPAVVKKNRMPQKYKDAIKAGAKLAAAALVAYGVNKVNENGSLIAAGQSIFDDFQGAFETTSDLFGRVFKKNKKNDVKQDDVNIIKKANRNRNYDIKDKNAYVQDCISSYDDIIRSLTVQKKGFNPVNKNLANAIVSDFTNILRSREGFSTRKDVNNLMFMYQQTLSRIKRPENKKYSSDFTQELLKLAIEDLKDIANFIDDK